MTRKEALSGAWIWAIVVAMIPELVFFVYLGFSGVVQAGIILFLTWRILKIARGLAVIAVVFIAAILEGPPFMLLETTMFYHKNAAGIIDMTSRSFSLDGFIPLLPVIAFRSIPMMIALTPVAILHLQKPRPT